MYKRLFGVLTVRDGILVKSYGYRSWRPAGRVQTALTNLDCWGADEILVLDISRRSPPDSQVLRDLRLTPVSTPVTYGGGIRTAAQVRSALDAGVDRILIESLLWNNPSEVIRISEEVGAQAIVGGMPICTDVWPYRVWDPRVRPQRRPSTVEEWVSLLASSPIEEVLVTDVVAEGDSGKFSIEMANGVARQLSETNLPIIWFGGINAAKGSSLLRMQQTTGVAFGNALHESELALPRLRARLSKDHPNAIRTVKSANA